MYFTLKNRPSYEPAIALTSWFMTIIELGLEPTMYCDADARFCAMDRQKWGRRSIPTWS